jgi:carboxymethylenebutenolidase
MRRALLVLSLLVSLPALAQTVTFQTEPAGGGGFLAAPATPGKHPALLVIQEWWGVNDWIRQQTERFAKEGYVALAVDLYRGKVATTQEQAHELMRGLPHDRAMGDLAAGFKYLAGRKDVDTSRIGVIGWCMGGGYALDFTVAEPRLAASVINYGHLMVDQKTIASIKPPILGNFGATDMGIPPADVKAFDAALKKAGKSSDIKIYEGAGHAFMNPNNTGGYVKAAADDAWARIDAFLVKRLKRS